MLCLYAVTDRAWISRPPHEKCTLEEQVTQAIEGGATMIQLREKELTEDDFLALARRIIRITDSFSVPLIINDNLKAALLSGAAGVHVGQHDEGAARARKLGGRDFIVGVSAQTEAQAKRAEADGADYLGVGAVFATATKADAASVPLETLSRICASVNIPVVAIGGIGKVNARLLKGSGIAGIAVVSAVFSRPLFVREETVCMKQIAQEICR